MRLFDIADDVVAESMRRLKTDVDRSVRRGDLTTDDAVALTARIRPTADLSSAVEGAGLVIEAAPEDLRIKQETFASIERLVSGETLLATNTSSLSVTSLASAVATPHRVIGLHFFNPVHRMDLVEIVVGLESDDDAVGKARAYCAAIGKSAVVVRDRAGFVTSRVNAMIGNEAFHMLMEGVASADDIDLALKKGLNHPMGPFELVDLVGLDTRLSVLQRLRESLGERFRPNPLLVDYVEAGRLGRKTGRGVFDYDADGNRLPSAP